MGGCLWSLLPFPILLALYRAIRCPITIRMGVSAEAWNKAMWEENLCRDRGLGRVGSIREMIDRADEALTAGFSDGDLTRLEDFLDRMAENMKSVQENGDAEISAKQKTEQERLESL